MNIHTSENSANITKITKNVTLKYNLDMDIMICETIFLQ